MDHRKEASVRGNLLWGGGGCRGCRAILTPEVSGINFAKSLILATDHKPVSSQAFLNNGEIEVRPAVGIPNSRSLARRTYM